MAPAVNLLLLGVFAVIAFRDGASQRVVDGCAVVPGPTPLSTRACPTPTRGFAVRNSARSAGPLVVAKLRPNRDTKQRFTVRPGSARVFRNTCPGVQYYLEAKQCAKCIEIYSQPLPSTNRSHTVTIADDFCPRPAADTKPNIVMMMVDDISSRDFGFNGASYVQTPNLDTLVRKSFLFVNAWATPLCRTTRAIIMTGKLPYETKWFAHKEYPPAEFLKYGPGFGNLAQEAGYKTLMAGKWQIFGTARGPGGYGFDEYSIIQHSDIDDVEGIYTTFDGQFYRHPNGTIGMDQNRYAQPIIVKNDRVVDTDPLNFSSNMLLDHIQSFMRKNKREGEKSFVWWPSPLAHKDYDFERDVKDWVSMPILDDSGNVIGFDDSTPTFPKMIGYMDTVVGLFIEGLKRDGLYNDTLFIFCSDNGSPNFDDNLNRHKGDTAREGSVRVPVIFHHGGGLVPAGTTSALFSLVDMYSTLAGFMKRSPSPPRPNSVNFEKLITGVIGVSPRKWLFSFQREDRMLRVKKWFMNRDKAIFRCRVGDAFCADEVDPNANPAAGRAKARMENILEELESTGYYDPASI